MRYAIELRVSKDKEDDFKETFLAKGADGKFLEDGININIVKHHLNSLKKGNASSIQILVKDKINNRFYIFNPFDTLTPQEEKNDYVFYYYYNSSYTKALEKGLITPILDNSKWDKLNIISCESVRQIAWTAITNKWNFTDTLGLPFAIGMLGGILRFFHELLSFEKKYNRKINLEELSAIENDCAAFIAKMFISMGSWNLGCFIGQSLLTFYAITPLTWLAPLTLALCAGFTQAMGTVLSQAADEKSKHNEIRSSSLDFAKLFFSTMISGAAWQGINHYFPVPWIAGLVTFVTLGAIKTLPELVTSAPKSCCDFSFFPRRAREHDASAPGLGLLPSASVR